MIGIKNTQASIAKKTWRTQLDTHLDEPTMNFYFFFWSKWMC